MVRRNSDRRSERRYIVVGVRAEIAGANATIIDLSRSGVRFARPPGFVAGPPPTPLSFYVGDHACPLAYHVSGLLVRQSPFEVVYGYEAPFEQWEALLKSLDTFEHTRLRKIRI